MRWHYFKYCFGGTSVSLVLLLDLITALPIWYRTLPFELLWTPSLLSSGFLPPLSQLMLSVSNSLNLLGCPNQKRIREPFGESVVEERVAMKINEAIEQGGVGVVNSSIMTLPWRMLWMVVLKFIFTPQMSIIIGEWFKPNLWRNLVQIVDERWKCQARIFSSGPCEIRDDFDYLLYVPSLLVTNLLNDKIEELITYTTGCTWNSTTNAIKGYINLK